MSTHELHCPCPSCVKYRQDLQPPQIPNFMTTTTSKAELVKSWSTSVNENGVTMAEVNRDNLVFTLTRLSELEERCKKYRDALIHAHTFLLKEGYTENIPTVSYLNDTITNDNG